MIWSRTISAGRGHAVVGATRKLGAIELSQRRVRRAPERETRRCGWATGRVLTFRAGVDLTGQADACPVNSSRQQQHPASVSIKPPWMAKGNCDGVMSA